MTHIDLSQRASSHNPFITPDGYFADFAQNMMQRIVQSETRAHNSMPFVRWIPWLGAACVATLFLLFAHFKPETTHTLQQGEHFVAKGATTHPTDGYDEAYDYIMTTDNKDWAYGNDY